jgi:hypothetical protein
LFNPLVEGVERSEGGAFNARSKAIQVGTSLTLLCPPYNVIGFIMTGSEKIERSEEKIKT